MQSFLLDYSILHPFLTYFIIFLGIALEGDVILFTSAFLADQGYLNPFIIILVTLLGVGIRDFLWYEIGKKIHASDNWIVARARKIADPFDNHLKDRLFQSVLVAKFVYGLHLAIIMRVGGLKIPMKEFVKADAIATLIWIVAVGGLGFLSSRSVELFAAQDYLKYIEVALAGGVVGYLILHSIISHFSKRLLK